MPTILTHMAVPLSAGLGLGRATIPRRLLIAGALGAMLPDLDVVGFRFGLAYASDFGHRGFSHSLFIAALLALAGAACYRYFGTKASRVFAFLFVSIASHGLLDCVTDGGYGVALWWPFSSERVFAPFQVIQVSPIGLSRFLSARGVAVLASEVVWVWLPCAALGGLLYLRSRRRRGHPSHESTAPRPS